MKRTTSLKRKTRLRLHPETERNFKAYATFRKVYLSQHPYCEMEFGCMRNATQIHHFKGHGHHGDLLCDERWLRSICSDHHRFIHDHPNEARKKGWLLM